MRKTGKSGQQDTISKIQQRNSTARCNDLVAKNEKEQTRNSPGLEKRVAENPPVATFP
jgi:hypothetical protein